MKVVGSLENNNLKELYKLSELAYGFREKLSTDSLKYGIIISFAFWNTFVEENQSHSLRILKDSSGL